VVIPLVVIFYVGISVVKFNLLEKIKLSLRSSAETEKNSKIRVLFWNTTFQADNLTLARYLDNHSDFSVAVVLQDKANLVNEPVHKLLPLKCEIYDRDDPAVFSRIKKFDPVITIVDNHFPPKKLSPYLFVLWHGFGWKGPNDKIEFAQIHKSIKRLTGFSSFKPNPRFRWQCFGKTDLEHRNTVSGFARENLLDLGSAFTDDLVNSKFSREDIIKFYPDQFQNRKIALIACTWHYGRMFSHWGDDIEILTRLSDLFEERNFAVILRLHDKKRFDPSYLEALEKFASKHKNFLLKFKDSDKDNLLDICVSDIMISNFSSILNYFYATLKPSIHIYPVTSKQEAFLWRVWKKGTVQISEVPSADFVWKLPPEENGGLLAKSVDELVNAIITADKDTDCCKEKSIEFINRHMASVDGNTCKRIADALTDFVTQPDKNI